MNPTPSPTPAGQDAPFGPEQAAALLDQTTQHAHRQLTPSPPWLLATRAVAVLAVCGAVWLTVRGQHPYHGPTAAVVPVLIAFIVLNFAATVAARERAVAGVRGSTRFRPAEITVMVLSWAAVPPFIWALATAGIGLATHPTTVLIIPGLAYAAVMTAKAGWRRSGTGLAVAALGLAGAFAGPTGAWAVAGIGLCALLLGRAAAITWRQHHSAARP